MVGFSINQAGQFIHSLSGSCDTVTTLVPMSAGFILRFICRRHSSTVGSSLISPTLLATKICWFSWEKCSHWRTVIESVQCVTVWILTSWSSVINCLSLTEYSAACSSNFGIVCSFIDAIHFSMSNDNSIPSTISARSKATIHIDSREASEKICKAIFL